MLAPLEKTEHIKIRAWPFKKLYLNMCNVWLKIFKGFKGYFPPKNICLHCRFYLLTDLLAQKYFGFASFFFLILKDCITIDRLDFDDLTLSPPTLTTTGNPVPLVAPCLTDTFTVTSSSGTGTVLPPVPPVLCGVLTGSHSKFFQNSSKILKHILGHNKGLI